MLEMFSVNTAGTVAKSCLGCHIFCLRNIL